MSEQDKMRLRKKLLDQRQEIFEQYQRFEFDLQAVGERDIEMEDDAQKADEISLLDQLVKRDKDKLEEIDLALFRMAAGNYGICERCLKPISLERLETSPTSRLCRMCARKYDEKQKKLPRAWEVITRAELPDEYKNLGNKELQMVILESIRNDGRIDLNELEISCRNGVVYLEGAVPNENERQILIRLLSDVMGLTSIIDHLRIRELISGRKDLSPAGETAVLGTEEDSVYNVDKISDDVIESEEEEIPYYFPDRPPAEKE
jgi:RNA polymerase-binding transcription factor DksA